MMSRWVGAVSILGCALPHQSAEAEGPLDRLKRKVESASREARDLRDPVDSATDVEARVEAAVDSSVPGETQIDHRAAAGVESTSAVQAVRAAESDVHHVVSADERARAAARSELNAVERDVERATDLEGRARNEVGRTDAARTVQEMQREVQAVTTADERAQRDVQGQRDGLEGALED
jgi:hypothetical protein